MRFFRLLIISSWFPAMGFARELPPAAQKQIDFILKMTPDPDHVPEYDDAVAGAKELEKRIQS